MLRVDSWLDDVRRDLQRAEEREERRFEGLRSELVFSRVLARIQQNRRRRPWSWRSVLAVGAGLWRSKAFRILMP